MNKSTHIYLLYLCIVLLLFPALLINLGLMPVSADEATRAIVALEMQYSGNYITPTINGEIYLNKPPLYNWMLAGIFRLTGSDSEFILRFPTVFFLLIFGVVIFLTVRKSAGNRTAALGALAFIAAGRIIFYDSMLGLIDMSFSLLMFLNFIVIYHLFRKKSSFTFFLLSYLLVSAAFMMKGLPALVFQGLSLLAAAFYYKAWKKLFRLPHFTGIALFLGIVGSYYYLVSRQNSITDYFEVLFSESAKRTFIEYGWGKTLLNLFTFPFEQLYHLLPWSVFLIFLFQKSFYRQIRQSEFLSFLALVFLVNIAVYWISVDDYPRYLFMLYPILFILLMHHYLLIQSSGTKLSKIIQHIITGMIFISIPAMILAFILYPFEKKQEVFIILIISIPFLLALSFLSIKKPGYLPELTVIALLFLRIVFNFTIIPEREITSRISQQRQMALEVAKIAGDEDLKLQYLATCSHETTYDISRETGKILKLHRGEYLPGTYYLFDDRDPVRKGEQIHFRFETRWENSPLRLSIFEEVP